MNNHCNFASQQIIDLAEKVDSAAAVSVLGISGVGITLFLKHATTQLIGRIIYLDVFSLTSFKTAEFYKALLQELGGSTQLKDDTTENLISGCKKQVGLLVNENKKVVICITGFDQLQPEFSASFFHYLRSIRAVDPAKVVYIFGVCRRLDTLLPISLIDTDISLFSSVYYLKPYSKEDMNYLLSTYGPRTDLSDIEVSKLVDLSGGHFQLLQMLLNSEIRNNPTHDPFIQLIFKNIFMHLNTVQKAIVRKLATGGTYNKSDSYLTSIGIVKPSDEGHELFSKLFRDYVRELNVRKLPVKERRLLAVLKKNEGKIVSKQDIYDAIWRGTDIGSEWALNALVYRLRKHPTFIAQNYTIESHKKLGYSLMKEHA